MPLHRYRTFIILLCVCGATIWTSALVRRQTALLLPANQAAGQQTSIEAAVPQPSSAPTPPVRAEPGTLDPTPTLAEQVPPPETSRAAIIDHDRFFYEPDFYAAQIQAWLETQPGPLKDYRALIGDETRSFADILSSQSIYFSVNPKVLLALIEQQSALITNPAPSDDQSKWMMGYHGDNEAHAGWVAQLRWARRELHRAQNEFPDNPELVYVDQTHSALPPGLGVADYAVARVLAATTTSDRLAAKLDGGSESFVATYTRLFGDPRDPPTDWPAPSDPFLSLPMDRPHQITSFFDHEAPFLQNNGTIVTYRGDRQERLSYDGHDGWDFAMMPPEEVLAAADGTVVYAGNAADGCNTRSVVIDHGNGYRTLYWHLARPEVEQNTPVKRGDVIGIAGSSGCVTGPHLHFGVQFLGRGVDPAGWCGSDGADPWANHPAGAASAWLWRDVPSPCDLPENAIVVDTTDPGFTRIGGGWEEAALGLGGTALYVPSTIPTDRQLAAGVWRPTLPHAGTYRVLAWIPYILSDLKDAEVSRYVVGHADGSGDTQQVAISQWETGNWWADLGVYEFDPARTPFVGLTASDRAAGNNVWYDSIIWIPVDE